jgi:GTP-binding protein HflX
MNQRFLLIQVINPHYHQDLALGNMGEAEQLVTTYGGLVIEKTIQHRVHPHPHTYIGEGKVEWLKQTIKDRKIDVVVLNDIVNSGQIFRLEKELWQVSPRIAVWDRVDLILNIFDQHATTNEAKLQIELARIHHLGPRIYGLGGTVLSRQGGGIGTRGLGETNLEIERRNIKKRQQSIRKQLKQLTSDKQKVIAQRQKLGIQTVALVGYTSAGKTTLFNALTSKQKNTNRGLFTTLETVVGKVKLTEYSPTILISDTIGFIENLPPFLIEAFRSTLLESLSAQLIVHVIDAADPEREEKMKVVEQILDDLGLKESPLKVFNKIDKLTKGEFNELNKRFSHSALFISAHTRYGLDALKQVMHKRLRVEYDSDE